MDFPEFFKLTKVNDFIKSSRWRGLALLSSPINAGSQVDMMTAATGDLFTDRDSALHIIVKPQKAVNITPTTAVVTALIAKPGVRYYIHGVDLSTRLIAADTTTGVYVTGTIDGTAVNFAVQPTVPSIAGAYSEYVQCNILDRKSVV